MTLILHEEEISRENKKAGLYATFKEYTLNVWTQNGWK